MQCLYDARLGILIKDVLKNNQYYSQRLRACDAFGEDVFEMFSCLKPVKKDQIVDNYMQCLDDRIRHLCKNEDVLKTKIFGERGKEINREEFTFINGERWIIENTTGTTGRSLPIVKSERERFIEALNLMKVRKKLSSKMELSTSMLLVQPTDKVIKNLDLKGDLDEYKYLIQYIKIQRPTWIFASTYIINRLIEYIKKNELESEIQHNSVDFIETTSQVLLEDERNDIERILGCKVVNNYGCREVWNIAYETAGDGKLYVNDENVLVELYTDEGDKITEDGCSGNVVITSLIHRTFPIIKYCIGDFAKMFHDEQGKEYLVLEQGRDFERIKGTPYFGSLVFRTVLRTLNYKYGINDIKKIKIVQKEIREMDVFLDKEIKFDKDFEVLFEKIFISCIKNSLGVKLNYIYAYPFMDNKSIYKDKIYETLL